MPTSVIQPVLLANPIRIWISLISETLSGWLGTTELIRVRPNLNRRRTWSLKCSTGLSHFCLQEKKFCLGLSWHKLIKFKQNSQNWKTFLHISKWQFKPGRQSFLWPNQSTSQSLWPPRFFPIQTTSSWRHCSIFTRWSHLFSKKSTKPPEIKICQRLNFTVLMHQHLDMSFMLPI